MPLGVKLQCHLTQKKVLLFFDCYCCPYTLYMYMVMQSGNYYIKYSVTLILFYEKEFSCSLIVKL